MLVKSRDGRPIKLEGNPEHPLSRGGLCAVGQASLLGLYDQHRLDAPRREGKEVPWTQIDEAIRAGLQAPRNNKERAVRFLTGPVVSPTTRRLIQRFLSTFPNGRHVVLDPRPGSAILEAHLRTHGIRLLPHYHFERADVVVSFDADFLGTWISPVEFTSAYQAGRRPQGNPPRMSYHVQFESRMSLTGSKADQRLAVQPGAIGLILSHLATRLAARAKTALPAERLEDPPVAARFLDHLVEVLWQSRRRSLVVCGQQDVTVQVLCNFINHLLGNYGITVDLAQPSDQLQAGEGVEALLGELHNDRVEALFVYQCNPVHDLPSGEALEKDLRRVPLLVCCSERLDETAHLARFVCPVPHFLESWSDAEPIDGLVSLIQPGIAPLGNTRSLLESLTAWMSPPPAGRPPTAYDLLRTAWEAEIFPRRREGGTFQAFWDQTLHTGFAQVEPHVRWREDLNVPALAAESVGLMSSPLAQSSLLAAAARRPGDHPFKPSAVRLVSRADSLPEGTFSVVLYPKVGMPDARHAYNPWLHELPDPVSKVAWDNYACLSPAAAKRLGVTDGDVVRLEAAEANGETRTLELPAFVQPGQHDQVVAVALGYGSVHSKRFAGIGPPWLEARPTVGPNGMIGQNAAPFLTWIGGNLRPIRDGVRLSRIEQRQPLASTQGYHRLTVPAKLAPAGKERRPILQEATLAEFRKGRGRVPLPMAGVEKNLWPKDHASEGAHWGMVIDHNACTGCSACVIACQVENNIPVVGKDEVRRHREMHWLRLDRYYSDRGAGVDVVHQPMLCQHCENAPCETVCPVLATVHGSDGLNQQVYNRCVGTRYCANNCPYKVRRFNWFDYAHDDTLENLTLNPDVTVRSRGVMEKCTFCVQRIHEARAEAARQGLPVRDGDVQTACQQSCPAQAITFGNLNDPKSRVAQQARSPRAYRALEELNVRPSVSYLTLVRNRPVDPEGEANG
jgi:molybdopterin-containing oxidoreductase family iron-sulfur binding subunit